MNEQKETVKPIVKMNEIDYVVLAKKLWAGRRTILKGLGVGTVLGLIFAISAPKQFSVTTTMLPQGDEGGMSKISSLASLAGFDLNMDGGSDISPVLYPQILASEPFMLDIMNSKYSFSKMAQPVTMFDYYTKYQKPGVVETIMKYTLGLPGVILKAIRKEPAKFKESVGGPIQLTKAQDQMMKSLREQITLTVNKKDGYVTLTCIFPEALLAAQVAQKTQELLQKRITDYKIQKSNEQLKFIQQRYTEKKRNYESIQNRLASYKDRNLNVFTAAAGTEEDRLQNEYNIAYSVYSELAKQLEQAQIQVKNDTPVFAILKPIVVPLVKSKPNRFLILFIWIALGGIVGSGIIASKEYLTYYRKKSDNIIV